ncbi:MAG: response regulator [Bacteroidetes bacterium]|nr:MAG: response regulator [Bacteroidota bacterium]
MRKLLVVDDETDIKELFLQKFRKEIFKKMVEFQFAHSGDEALDILKQNDHEAILILSDINMPGMSGLELLERIKIEYKSPPPIVMMITAYGDEHNYNTAKELGADDFLTKPLDFKKLKEKINL